ncbi:MAG: hypothetical protein H0W72_02900 [Planctomycetes bacterium]|nr:hypothetical protein [Planctomycetota bacterium]
MDWINLHVSVLDSPEFIGAEPEHRATWLCLLRYCVGQENGGVISVCSAWGDRRWQQQCRVTLKEVRQKSDLWEWIEDKLVVRFYPLDKQREVQRLRANASKGADARWKRESIEQGVPQGIPGGMPQGIEQALPQTEDQGNAEGKGREGKGKEWNGTGIADAAPARPTGSLEDRWQYEAMTSWVRALTPVLGRRLGPKTWTEYKRLVDRYGINLVDATAQDATPDDRWPSSLEDRLIRAKSDLDRKHASAPDADPLLDLCRRIVREQGWEACLATIAIPNVPDEGTLFEALSANRSVARKLVAKFDPDADRAQQGAA